MDQKTLVRQREVVQEQQSLLQHGLQVDKVIDSLHKTPPFKGKRLHRRHRPPTIARQPQPAQGQCSRCGRGLQCPARDAECHTCHKKGHYSAQCFHKSVADVAREPDAADHYDRAYLNTIGVDQVTMWNCTIRVDGHEVPFKVDTGAEVTVTSEELWTSLHLSQLKPPTKRLHGPDSKPLKVTGELCATLQYRGHQCIQPIFVVKHLQHNLLGLPAIQALHVLAQVDGISTPIPEQYPNLFKGLGTFKGNSYTIQLKPDAKSFADFTPAMSIHP